MARPCPSCKQPASGRFCSHCGADLVEPAACTECGNQLPVGGRFCNQCGAATPATRAALEREPPPRTNPLPWAIAGGSVVALVAALLVWVGRAEEPAPTPAAPFATAAGDPTQVDLSSMTPREAADRLYTRVMTLAESGDSAQARTFLPMALAAYERVPELDADARYHIGVLHLFAGDPATTLAQADTILATEPDHLFGLHNAAAAHRALGDQARARELLQRFLDVYDAQVATGRPEYEAHQPVLTIMLQDASRTVDSP